MNECKIFYYHGDKRQDMQFEQSEKNQKKKYNYYLKIISEGYGFVMFVKQPKT